MLRVILSGYTERMAAQLGCIAYARISSIHAGDHPHRLTYLLFTPQKAFPLANRSPLWLTVKQTVRLDREYNSGNPSVEIVGYLYRIGFGDEGSQELLAYHFDPFNQESGSRAPHLHVGRSAYRPLATGHLRDFHKRHVHTGQVSFPIVVRFLNEELGVEPITPNWDRILAGAYPA